MGQDSANASNADLVRYGYEALNRREPERILELMAPSARYRFRPPGGGEETLAGVEALREFYAALYQIFDLVQLDCREVETSGDTVHVSGSVTLRARESRQSTHASFRHTYTMRNGYMVSATFEDPVNPLELMRAASDREVGRA